ncbi:hypothetical protein T07_5305 [Trichinella nelsoni]|uniref:Uncharacterized protein n=1 Tax=Trichinella nelsoni TaxID=6336 RepID=A0A0V0SEW8_9BILA|nr:hypothetical protein T07_5305 [Trichinella nelsoni]
MPSRRNTNDARDGISTFNAADPELWFLRLHGQLISRLSVERVRPHSGDCCSLNDCITPDRYPLPHLADLAHSYYHIPVQLQRPSDDFNSRWCTASTRQPSMPSWHNVKKDLNCSAAEMLDGSVLRLPVDFFMGDASTAMHHARGQQDEQLLRQIERLLGGASEDVAGQLFLSKVPQSTRTAHAPFQDRIAALQSTAAVRKSCQLGHQQLHKPPGTRNNLGKEIITVQLADLPALIWTFIVSDVQAAIMDADFLYHHYAIAVGIKLSRLIMAPNNAPASSINGALAIQSTDKYQSLLARFYPYQKDITQAAVKQLEPNITVGTAHTPTTTSRCSFNVLLMILIHGGAPPPPDSRHLVKNSWQPLAFFSRRLSLPQKILPHLQMVIYWQHIMRSNTFVTRGSFWSASTRHNVKKDLNCSAAEMLDGSVLRLPVDFFMGDASTGAAT